MKSVADFNYKVALASGLKHLQRGKLRQAEEQFRYLVAKFPRADGGYRGLARVQVELGDRPAALGVLRDGAAALARAGERPAAIELLREAVGLDPLDLAAHRRLAAALALAGDVAGAAAEYDRFALAELAAGDPERARLEATYALDTLGAVPALRALATSLGIEVPAASRPAPAPPAAGDAVIVRPTTVASERAATSRPREGPRETGYPPKAGGSPAGREGLGGTARSSTTEIPPPPPASTIDPLVLEARAMALIASRDRNAGPAAVEAARALAAKGKMHAASDLLLDLIASGIAVHEAERELVAVSRGLGRDDIADERERLLVEATRSG